MYSVQLKKSALKELDALPDNERARIIKALNKLESGLTGDIKKLTNFTPEYRLRVGNYRILFEIDGTLIIIYHIKHRKEVYR